MKFHMVSKNDLYSSLLVPKFGIDNSKKGRNMELFIPRSFTPLEHSYFLFGPRGTGKSTFLRHQYPDALWIDLLKPDVFRTFASRPERIIELVHGNPGSSVVVVDEVQKVPELLSAVHSLIEEKSGRQFILTGSSARTLKRFDTDLLAGRVLWRTLHPFLFSELTLEKTFAESLQHGMLPVVVSSPVPSDTLATYISLYIREEVQMEGLTRKVGNFSRFLEAASFSHASVLNTSNVARECQVERKTVESYIGILEDILLAFKVPVFSKKAKRALISHAKFYFFDTGVFRALRPAGPLDRPEEIEGAALEGLVAQQFRAWNAYSGNRYEMFFWRTQGGVEVDFILYGEDGIHAFEVKNSDRVRPEDLRGLKAFRQDYPACTAVLLYRGKERLLVDNIQCLPCADFLRELVPGTRLPIMA